MGLLTDCMTSTEGTLRIEKMENIFKMTWIRCITFSQSESETSNSQKYGKTWNINEVLGKREKQNATRPDETLMKIVQGSNNIVTD